MSLSAGRTLSHYRLVAPIGEGGMGVVWRATDSTLGRDVAIKVLPAFLAGDPERLARFEREAKLLASLNHPHIASIFGFHEDGGVRFLAMELVEGEDLAQRLARGAIPAAEALPLALQVAQALEHAHEKGVIHRDLKPANVKLTAGGQAKVPDFGLAKALEGEAASATASKSEMSASPTITGNLTGANVLLGTAAYMAPEQARGQVADRRADIWGFGVLLMEMLTGRRTFEGETISDTLASVLKTDPDWSALPKDTLPRVRTLLRRCLERNPKQRLRDIGEARILLEDVIAGRGEEPAAATAAVPAPRVPPWAIALAALVLGASVMYGITRFTTPPRAELPLRKFQVPVAGGGTETPAMPAISPDGRRVAYLLPGRLVVQPLDALTPRVIPVEAGPMEPFWSPDGRYVGFIAGARVFKVAADGGQPQAVSDSRGVNSTGGWGACWREDGTIVITFGDTTGLLEVPSGGGDPRQLLKPGEKEGDFHVPSELPGGRGLIFPVHQNPGTISQLWLLAGGKRKLLLDLPGQALSDPVYSRSGHILFRRDPTTPGIWALPFSLSRLEPTGEPFMVAPEGTSPSVANDGTLAYVGGGANSTTQLTWVDASGKELGTIGSPEAHGGWDPALAPDGRRVARSVSANENRDVFVYDAERGTRTRLTFDLASEQSPAWSPRGDRITYQAQPVGASNAQGLQVMMRAADGSGAPDSLAAGADPGFTPDGRNVVFLSFENGAQFWHLAEVPVDGPRTPRIIVRGNPRVQRGAVAPTGDLMAYMSIESGQWEVFLTRYPSGEGRWQVSTAGGQWPAWSARGDKLYFAQGDDIVAVDVKHGPSPVLGTPQRLFSRQALGTQMFNWYPRFGVNAEGTRFVVVHSDRGSAGPQLTLAQNWYAEFAKGGKKE